MSRPAQRPRSDPSQGLVDELPEVFERFGRVSARRMFGGYGLFHEDRMFGLVTRGRLYLKTDEHNRALFEAKGLPPFEYTRRGELTATSYFEAPAEIFEDRDEAARWASLAWSAVLRKGNPNSSRRGKANGENGTGKAVAKTAPKKKAASARR